MTRINGMYTGYEKFHAGHRSRIVTTIEGGKITHKLNKVNNNEVYERRKKVRVEERARSSLDGKN